MPDTTTKPRNSIIQKILEQSKHALRGGLPILYIKTDSDVLIHQLVTDRDNPLVLLTHDGRPHTEWSDERIHNGSAPLGYAAGLPDLRVKEESAEQDETLSFLMQIQGKLNPPQEEAHYPFLPTQPTIWVQKLPDGAEPHVMEQRAALLAELEKYVVLHQDKAFSGHALLRSCVVLLYAQDVYLTPMLKTYSAIIDVERPDENDIRDQICAQTGTPAWLTDDLLKFLITNLRGFSGEEICTLLEMLSGNINFDHLDQNGQAQIERIIRDFKTKNLEGGLLEIIVPESEIGGMGKYREDLQKILAPLKNTMDYRRVRGVNPPKGDLLTGIQGCGKSELAKYTAQELNLPLLKLDMGKVMNMYQGESERQMRATIKLAESMSPCVLFFDELEKALSANKKGSGSENDAAQRMFGYLLGWMQDHTAPVYIFATSNDITGLPKELFRSGRFRNRYAVYLPTQAECVSIFKASMKRAEKIAAKAQGIAQDEIDLFPPECSDDSLFNKLIEQQMILADGTPRIMIGSDIQQIVDTALQSIPLHSAITPTLWFESLQAACEDLSMEGDSEENVEHFAASYCRLLRKGFRPASDHALFQTKDYHIGNLKKIDALETLLRSNPNAFEGKEAEKKKAQEDAQILQRNTRSIKDKYDIAVYNYLFDRINDLAPLLERKMRDQMTNP